MWECHGAMGSHVFLMLEVPAQFPWKDSTHGISEAFWVRKNQAVLLYFFVN